MQDDELTPEEERAMRLFRQLERIWPRTLMVTPSGVDGVLTVKKESSGIGRTHVGKVRIRAEFDEAR